MKQRIEYGYARGFSKDKEAAIQLSALQEAKILRENIFVDQAGEKEKLKKLTNNLQAGDLLVIKSLSQLGYTCNEILNEWTTITNTMGAHIRVLDMNLVDTSVKRKTISDSFVTELVLQIMTFVAQQERDHIRQRQAEGIAYARAQGRHLGRPRIPKPINFNYMYDQWRAGVISAEEAMAKMSLKRSTFERFVKERKEELKRGIEKAS